MNTASRMESHGEPGRIQVSGAVASRLGARYDLEERGTVEVKVKGAMRTWWLGGTASPSRAEPALAEAPRR